MPATAEFSVLPVDVFRCETPRILWVELTSKCPFDCVFCSRQTLRGAGEHMDFALYRGMMASLKEPEIIRLNYSGESAHYPHLIEAIELAHATGAFTEMVTAFSSFPLHRIDALVKSGLDRLTVSLHTLDAGQFARIYRYSSLADMKARLAALREAQERLGRTKPLLDFAFVALQENVDQLPALAEYARELGVNDVAIHPLIRRDEIPVQFPAEIEGKRLRPEFIGVLQEAVANVRAAFPDVQFSPSTCELGPVHPLGSHPQYLARKLAEGERIFSCDQSPWDSVHVLANGDVVTCEARDKIAMGNLRQQSLPEIWQSEVYDRFRRRYQQGDDEECRSCPYKLAYVPGPLRSAVTANDNQVELIAGWHASEGDVVWSKRRGRAVLQANLTTCHPAEPKMIEVRGLLPAPRNGAANVLSVWHDGREIGAVRNSSASGKVFRLRAQFQEESATAAFEFVTSQPLRPAEFGSADVRELGFALSLLRVTTGDATGAVQPKVPRLALAVKIANRLEPLLRGVRIEPKKLPAWRPGISIVIPERGTPGQLERTLKAAYASIGRIEEPSEVIVVVNGAPFEDYAKLRARFSGVRWFHSAEPLGFSGAIARGLAKAGFDWVYLLNSDMVLQADALAEAARWRADHVFAIASQIFFADAQARREETGWTGFRVNKGLVEIFDVPPEDESTVRGHLYAGGGASLFRRELLRRFMSGWHPYNPVYWEDVEWGVRAWRAGYEVLFCPMSKATHTHRATVSRCFEAGELERIVRRNQLLFSLRNGFQRSVPLSFDDRTGQELGSWRQALSLLKARVCNALAPARTVDLARVTQKFQLRPARAGKASVLVVSPFVIYPPTHGSARRIANLVRCLSEEFDIVLLSDEESLYRTATLPRDGPIAIHLLSGRAEKGTERDRIARVRVHSHERLRVETRRLARAHDAALVQIEHVELAALIEERRDGTPWNLTLHDVLLSERQQTEADRFEADLIRKYDRVLVCSREDAALLSHGRAVVVPNGLERKEQTYVRSRGRKLLFLGPFRYEPNLSGMRRFLEGVYPALRRHVPGVEIDILGGRDGRLLAQPFGCFRQPGVRIGEQVEDVQPWLSACALTINPLAGMRGSSIKLLESIGAGRVCVSTQDGARGFLDLGADGLIVTPRIEDFLEPLRELLVDEDRRIARERPSEELLQRLGWEASARMQAELYRKQIEM